MTIATRVSDASAIEVAHFSHRYGDRQAVSDLSFTVALGEVFALLGPNGSGKTTLFRTLATLIPLQDGEVRIFGHSIRTEANQVRRRIGVVFQAPSVDKKLTVFENLRCHGRLYGLAGSMLRTRADEVLSRLGLTERAGDFVETLSGGLRRRLELAQALLHRPQILLMDEPSTGLDPGARHEVWRYLDESRSRDGVTILLTTHLLEEAERAGRIAIMHKGRLAALDTPAELRELVGGDTITIRAPDPRQLALDIRTRFGCDVHVVDGELRWEQASGHEWIPRLMEAFPGRIESITLGKPTLEDVFIARTGERFGDE
jgi:ABC-2 type transport system ATP-binding protein